MSKINMSPQKPNIYKEDKNNILERQNVDWEEIRIKKWKEMCGYILKYKLPPPRCFLMTKNDYYQFCKSKKPLQKISALFSSKSENSNNADDIFHKMGEFNCEQIIFFREKNTGLKGITCIHDTTLGGAMGGTRLLNYKSTNDALVDVMRLSRGMTYKNASAGINKGGCKNVIIADPSSKNEMFMRAYGKYINTFGGRVCTGEDVNINTLDCSYMAMEAKKYITGIDKNACSSSIMTSYGVFLGIKAALKSQYDSDDISQYSFAIQGVGNTGYHLIKLLIENNAKKIYFTDLSSVHIERVKNEYHNVEFVEPKKIYSLDVDVFCPCALGGLLDDITINQLKAKIVAGSANNILADEIKHDNLLKLKGILYAPDFIINAGGVINAYHEIIGYDKVSSTLDTEKIYNRLIKIFNISKQKKIGTQQAALIYAQNRIDSIGEINKIFNN